MLRKWFPWQWLIRRLASSHGFIDPINMMSVFRRFGQPSEVDEPLELLRWGLILHARGLMNSRAIQNNLDWVWPYWVERQFDPNDDAFTPRAFSLTHINMTHRNWTALGLPDVDQYPIVDPAGALSPIPDGWTLDAWILDANNRLLAPSQQKEPRQKLELAPNLALVNDATVDGDKLRVRSTMELENGKPVVRMEVRGIAAAGGWLVVSLRPCNAEGVSFIHKIEKDVQAGKPDAWKIDGKRLVEFGTKIERHELSNYQGGDVALHLKDTKQLEAIECNVGMATAAAMYRLAPGAAREITATVSLESANIQGKPGGATPAQAWSGALRGACAAKLPDARMQFLYDAALRTLVLHSPHEVYPGPYTYRRFWFRDAAFIIHALIDANLIERSERALDLYPGRQTALGFFHSQSGEWDSNGESLWIMGRFLEATGRTLKPEWVGAVEKGWRWIARKRIPRDQGPPYGGLLPAGFSAEHLGPNDYYYWDDFWSVGGLESAARMFLAINRKEDAAECAKEGRDFMNAIETSLARATERIGRKAMPAAPERRLDAGAIGSLAVAYPLQLWAPDDPRVLDAAEWIMEKCFQQGGFFQDMIHSGINAYLTLHVAQALMRAGDKRHWDLVQAVARIASPTGQWPEAIHPRTGGGCMGDGQHVWAAAEWLVMVRNCFVLEEESALVLCAGVPEAWLDGTEPISLGPTPTRWGTVTIRILPGPEPRVEWEAEWRTPPPAIEVRLAGQTLRAAPGETFLSISRSGSRA